MKSDKLNWYHIYVGAATSIRWNWPVDKLIKMSANGYDTPVCGDTLQDYKR